MFDDKGQGKEVYAIADGEELVKGKGSEGMNEERGE
jgi:hypothetical protein